MEPSMVTAVFLKKRLPALQSTAGKQHRVMVPGEDFNQNRRHGGGKHGKEDEPLPVPGKAEIHRLTDGLHQEHPGKPQEAADEFF